MSCGNESALWDIIQFLLDKIHQPLGTHLPLHQGTPKMVSSFRDHHSFVLAAWDGALRVGGTQNEIGRAEEHPEEKKGSSRTALCCCSLVLIPSILQTPLENTAAPCRQPGGRAGEAQAQISAIQLTASITIWDGAGCLCHFPASALLEISKEWRKTLEFQETAKFSRGQQVLQGENRK